MLLYAALKEEKKTKGKARLTNMLKSGKELKVYTITQKDLAKLSQEAKRYGVLYCVLKDRKNTDPNAAVDVIARAEDASKIQRITERFKLTTVNRADVSVDIRKDKDRMFPKDKSVKESLRGARPEGEHEEQQLNPGLAKTDRDHLSEPSLTQTSPSNGFPGKTERASVREKMNAYKADIARKKNERAKDLANDMVSKGIDAARDIVNAVPIPKASGRDR